MRSLVRYITRKAKGAVTHEDKTFDGPTLTIGRSTDQAVFLSDLRVALEHARIAMGKDGTFVVHSDSVAGILVNNHSVQTGRLEVGHVIGIGGCTLQVVSPPDGYDLALDVEVPKAGRDSTPSRLASSKIDLEATRLSKRGWSWLLFVAILAAFLALPLAGFYTPTLQEKLRAIPGLPSDGVWEAGDLAKPHHFIGSDCNACHQKAFQMVKDQACGECHARTAQHADPDFYGLETFTKTRCAKCHKDHNGLAGVIRNDDKLCADCHESLSAVALETDLLDASDFGTHHPEFRPTLTRHLDQPEKAIRISLDDELNPPVEQSGLKFNHAAHLKEEGLRTPEGRVKLACGSCHVPEPGGALMRPIDMQTMCRECHQLNFDSLDPEREVPHGDMSYVIYTLQDYYGSRALLGGYDDPEVPEVVRRRRRPGEKLTDRERNVAQAWASQKWREVAEDMIELRTCFVCHDADLLREDPPVWKIRPVRVADVWFPKSYFTHAKHKTMECLDCHGDAPNSETSEDILMPPIDSCRECHGGAHDSDRLASTCIDCHKFHVFEDVLMGGRVAEAEPVPQPTDSQQ